jgi:hypothetical protein
MKNPAWLYTRAFRWALTLYPSAFRETFADEMYAVFQTRMSEDERKGMTGTFRFFLGEMADLALHALRERRGERRKGELPIMKRNPNATVVLLFSPLLLAAVLLLCNARYLLNLFSDLTGWMFVLGIVLSVRLGFILRGSIKSESTTRRLSAVLPVFYATLSILLGPAAILVTRFQTDAGTYAGRISPEDQLRIVILAMNLLLAAVLIANIIRNRKGGNLEKNNAAS